MADAEAATFAARFAADYLSYDEDDPALRADVLRGYLADPSAALLGWSGRGRQRCEFVIPGRTLRTDDGFVIVEATARVLTYHREPSASPDQPSDSGDSGGPAPTSSIGRSCAPPPSGSGWREGATFWVQIAPPVRRHRTGRLVIDFGIPATVDTAGPPP